VNGAHFRSAARQRGQPEPQGPQPPPGTEHIFSYFIQLHDGRASGGMGMAAITWPDLAAWSQLTGFAPSPMACRMVLMLDRAFLHEVSALQDAQQKLKAAATRTR